MEPKSTCSFVVVVVVVVVIFYYLFCFVTFITLVAIPLDIFVKSPIIDV